MPAKDAKEYLTSLYGVGPKTAAILLLFCFNKPSLPVDTHVFRVSKRLGLVPEKSNPKKAQVILEGKLDGDEIAPFHLGMINHGRAICTARNPKCEVCALQKICPSAKFLKRRNAKKQAE